MRQIILFIFLLISFCLTAAERSGTEGENVVPLKYTVINVANVSLNPVNDNIGEYISEKIDDILPDNVKILKDEIYYGELLTKEGVDLSRIFFNDDLSKLLNIIKSEIVISGFFDVSENGLMVSLKASDREGKTLLMFERRGISVSDNNKSLGGEVLTFCNELKAKLFKEKTQDAVPNFLDWKKITINNKVGVALFFPGCLMIVGGSVMFAFDYIYFFEAVRTAKNSYQNDGGSYSDYYNAYVQNMILFCSSITLGALGLIFIIASVPLMIYKNPMITVYKKQEKVSMFINHNPGGAALGVRMVW